LDLYRRMVRDRICCGVFFGPHDVKVVTLRDYLLAVLAGALFGALVSLPLWGCG